MMNEELEEKYVALLNKCSSDWDIEKAHVEADGLICNFLSELGYKDIVFAFEQIPKWYA